MAGTQGLRAIKNGASSGFKFKYEIKECQYGLGLFAAEDIPKGEVIWHFNPPHNVRTFRNAEEIEAHLAKCTHEEAQFFMSHVYMFDGVVNEVRHHTAFKMPAHFPVLRPYSRTANRRMN